MSAGKGFIKIVVSNAIGLTATVSYSGAASGATTMAITAKSQTSTISVGKGAYSVTVTIGSYSTTKPAKVG